MPMLWCRTTTSTKDGGREGCDDEQEEQGDEWRVLEEITDGRCVPTPCNVCDKELVTVKGMEAMRSWREVNQVWQEQQPNPQADED